MVILLVSLVVRKQPDYFQVKFYIGGLQLESFLQKWKRSILFLLG